MYTYTPNSTIFGNCFIGIEIPDYITRVIIDSYNKAYNKEIKYIKHTKPTNLHITLTFLGVLQDKEIANIRKILKKVIFKPFRITLMEASFWSSNIVVIEIACTQELLQMKQRVDQVIMRHTKLSMRSGIFLPHITVVRMRNKKKFDVNAYLPLYDNLSGLQFTVKNLHLYQSIRQEGQQADYIKLKTIY